MLAFKNTVIKGVYLMPTCSNPTIVYMPLQRRQKIACLAEQFPLLIIEDDIYSFLDPYHTASFFSILPKQTIHICSLSKSLCAGLRVAFLVFPLAYREILATGILDINLKTVSLNAEAISALIETVFRLISRIPVARFSRYANGKTKNATRSPAHSDLKRRQI